MAILAYLSGLLYIVAAFLLFMLGKVAYDFHQRRINLNAELLERDNLALALALSGYFLGLTLAVGGALAGTAPSLAKGLLSTLGYGLVAIVLLNVSGRLNDRLLLSRGNLEKEIITSTGTAGWDWWRQPTTWPWGSSYTGSFPGRAAAWRRC